MAYAQPTITEESGGEPHPPRADILSLAFLLLAQALLALTHPPQEDAP